MSTQLVTDSDLDALEDLERRINEFKNKLLMDDTLRTTEIKDEVRLVTIHLSSLIQKCKHARDLYY